MRTALLLLVAAIAVAAPTALADGQRASHDCVRGNEVWFTTADRVRLVGHRFGGLRPGARPAVVLAHQSNGSLCEWLPEARRLAARGIWVFAFDFRGHGLSKGRVNYGRLATDYAAAVKAVRSLGARNVVLAGASLGGIAAVVAGASIRPPVAGVAALSAPAVIAGRVDARPFAPRLAVPALFVAARGDQNPPYDFAADAQRLFDTSGSTAKHLELVEGSDHGVALVARSPAIRALLERFVRDPAATAGG
ncbi:MAG: alpha/beta hydrolase [Solirubrobacteraceae bacterium]